MKHSTTKSSNGPITRVMNSLLNRLTQSPDVYPIKFYMKGRRIRRNKYLYSAK